MVYVQNISKYHWSIAISPSRKAAWAMQNPALPSHSLIRWWFFALPLWKMMEWKSVGIMKFPRYIEIYMGKQNHVPNHQPAGRYIMIISFKWFSQLENLHLDGKCSQFSHDNWRITKRHRRQRPSSRFHPLGHVHPVRVACVLSPFELSEMRNGWKRASVDLRCLTTRESEMGRWKCIKCDWKWPFIVDLPIKKWWFSIVNNRFKFHSQFMGSQHPLVPCPAKAFITTNIVGITLPEDLCYILYV